MTDHSHARTTRIALAILAGTALTLGAAPARAQAMEQFVPINFFWVGPYAAAGTGTGAGMIDYFTMLNARDGGINGVRITWEKCETEYNTARGVECYERSKGKGPTGATMIHPASTSITYALIEKATADRIPLVSIGYGRTDASDGRVFPYVFPLITNYWSQNTAKIRFIGMRAGGMDKLRGKKIVTLYHDSAYGKETIPVLEAQAKRYGFELIQIPVAHPGNDQQAQWLQIRRINPDWVILRGFGVMNPTALKSAARVNFPRDRIVGVWWAGAEEDTIPAGSAAKGYIAAGFNVGGRDYPVIQDILKHVYAKGGGELEDKGRIGTIYYNRGVVLGLVTAEAIRTAQSHFGKGKPVNGEQIQWALEHLDIDAARLKALGATGFMQPLATSCFDHEGGGQVKFLQWDGARWVVISDWIASDQALVRPMIEASAASYAREKGIKPRDCPRP